MSKVTVEQFLNAGFKFVDGDIVINNNLYNPVHTLTDNTNSVNAWNTRSSADKSCYVKSLTSRPNTGTQPVGDDCIVDILYRDGTGRSELASWYDWSIIDRKDIGDILSWKPSLEYLENREVTEKDAIEWNYGDMCYTGKHSTQYTFIGKVSDGINCVVQDNDSYMSVAPIADLVRVTDREREEFIESTVKFIEEVDAGSYVTASRLYDAGYRKIN